MKSAEYLRNEAIKAVLVNMACDNTLPIDMHDLDIHGVVERAENGLKHNPDYTRGKMLDKLGEYICEDDIDEALQKLEKQNDIDASVMCDDIISMWEPMEYTFTVEQLLEEIS